METNRIKIKIGDAEFEAEGQTEIVQAQFDSFMKVVAGRATTAPAAQAPVSDPSATSAAANTATTAATAASEPSPDVLSRVFRDTDALSLAALPHSGENPSADAMLALLYGYLRLRNENAVTGTSLMKSAKISGIPIDRVDRLMDVHQPDFVLVAGVKKARRYQLNNRGIARAAQIINAIIE